ncbi:MAG TPA: NAD(P)/FAD-dependent oxidoreductase [Pyrinomonadaceae bacterium]|nr:NAD(P)/FAD-dependent oxidoreductase [Pyrinomonadaceae bacterium]
MASPTTRRKIVIVGAGASGPVMAVFLARRGHEVEVYERRPDMRRQGCAAGKSVNITLAERGLRVLKAAGVPFDELMRRTVPLKGRMVHTGGGRLKFQAYGQTDSEVIYSVMRNDVNVLLLDLLDRQPGVKLFFGHSCVGLDRQDGAITFREVETGEERRVKADVIIGADGTFSAVRRHMQRGVRADYTQMFLEAGYRELRIPAAPDGSYKVDPNVLHVWPRGECLLLAMANADGTFTCTCILPFEGERSFQALDTEERVMEFFRANFSDAVPLIPHLAEQFMQARTAEFITTTTSRWYYEDKVVILGDACHTVTPFYGQGMNAALEDCIALDQCIGKHGDDWRAAFAEFQAVRKRHTDVLAELSVRNYYELCDKARMPRVALQKKIDFALHRLFPNRWVPLYTMISHSMTPYADAVERARRQQRLLTFCGVTALLDLVTASAGLWLRLAGERPRRAAAAYPVARRSGVAEQSKL